MRITVARFPRPGWAIVPRALTRYMTGDSSDVSGATDGGFGSLGDLDASVWSVVDEATASDLAAIAARRAHNLVLAPPTGLAAKTLGDLAEVRSDIVVVSTRTRNALLRVRALRSEEKFYSVRLGWLFSVRGFGGMSLLDLLAAIEAPSPSLLETFSAAATDTVPSEFIAFVRAATRSPRDVEIALARFGWTEERIPTLAEVASRFGVTRERARQVVSSVQASIAGLAAAVGTPRLDEALTSLEADGVLELEALNRRLVEKGLLEEGGSVRRVALAAHFLDKETHGSRLVLDGAKGEPVSPEVASCARRVARRYGVVGLAELSVLLQQRDVSLEFEALGEAVRRLPASEQLDDRGGWFWTADCESGSPALNHGIRKALSVCDSVPLTELHQALSGHRRLSGRLPPFEVFAAVCARLEWLRVAGDTVRAEPTLSPEDVMVGDELAVVDLLRSHGPAMQVRDLWALASLQGMGRVSFWSCLHNSPAITRVGPSVYAPIGARIPAPSLMHLEEQVPPRNATVMKGWGRRPDIVWAMYRLTRSAIGQGRLTVPAAIRATMELEYTAKSVDDRVIGTITVDEGRVFSRLSPLLRRLGAEPGQWLLIIIIPTETALLGLGGEQEVRHIFDHLSSSSDA